MDYSPPIICVRNVIMNGSVPVTQWIEGDYSVVDMDLDTWVNEDVSKPLCPPGYPLFPLRD